MLIDGIKQTPLLSHYHPAVSLHARQLLSSVPLTASPDLAQNTLSHFLERFVYKNPKKPKATSGANDEEDAEPMTMGKGKGPSAMQPAASALEGVKLVKGDVGNNMGAIGLVNEKAFLRRRREDVPVDQVGFWNFFLCIFFLFAFFFASSIEFSKY
jgi:ribosome biogenesis protein MAK21